MQKIKKGDQVIVRVGRDKGRKGQVLKVLLKTNQLLVEGVNIVKKHHKSTGPNDSSRIIDLTKPILISKVALVCPNCHKPTRVGIRIDKQGNKFRYCKKCSQVIKDKEAK
ncbi:MAG: 50S ribosomal protein L24 [bacterium]|nr:50S ribosomal protein L24 [bacterium]